jgi:phasin family protein
MSKSNSFGNPFAEIDYTKIFTDFKMPGINADQIADSYRKNVEAISAASQVAVEGMQAVIKRQSEIMREYSAPTSPEEVASKQAEIAKHAYETTLAHLKEISDLITKSNSESIELINKRVTEMLDEVKGLAAKKKAKAA